MATSAGSRVELRGYERFSTLGDDSCAIIAHVMAVCGSSDALDELLAQLPQALVLTFNRHPRMRALQVRGEFAVAEIQSHVTLEALARDQLLEIRELSAQEAQAESWEQFAEDQSNLPLDRYAQLPFYLRVWRYAEQNRVRLMLFSDHYMADGISGLAVLNDVLSFAAKLSAEGAPQVLSDAVELPLRPSLLELWLGAHTWRLRLGRWAVRLFGKRIFRSAAKRFTPVITPRSDQAAFRVPVNVNSSSACFRAGSPENMRSALRRCKDESVTIFGAVAAAVTLAYYIASDRHEARKTPFTLTVGTALNMRQRVPTPPEEVAVGCFMVSSDLESLATTGVDVATTSFWDFARRCKQELDASLASVTMPLTPLFLDQYVHSRLTPALVREIPLPHSVSADVAISNVGRYPFALTHAVQSADASAGGAGRRTHELLVESVFVYNSAPNLGAAACAYLSSTDRFNYAMMHKYDAAPARRLFAAYVACLERVGGIGSRESLATVATFVAKAIGSDADAAAAH